MAKLSRVSDKRLRNPDQYRLRYPSFFLDGTRADRFRRYQTSALARAMLELATGLENRSRQLRRKTATDIRVWLNEGLISEEESARLDTSPPAVKKTLRQAIEEHQATWEVSPGEKSTRNSRPQVIQEILDRSTPTKDRWVWRTSTLRGTLVQKFF